MREQLIQYVSLLFAGAKNAEDIKQEILQNTLDRYDDMIAQGRSPESAYRLAISGIGDINEILNTLPQDATQPGTPLPIRQVEEDSPWSKLLRAVAVGLYILCPVPLFVLSDIGMETLGLCGTLALVAIATVLIILGKKKTDDTEENRTEEKATPRQELDKSVSTLIWTVGLAVYFIVSFITGAWYITWIIFPLIGAVQGLVKAIMDVKEG